MKEEQLQRQVFEILCVNEGFIDMLDKMENQVDKCRGCLDRSGSKFAHKVHELSGIAKAFKESLGNASTSPIEFAIYRRGLQHKLDVFDKRVRELQDMQLAAVNAYEGEQRDDHLLYPGYKNQEVYKFVDNIGDGVDLLLKFVTTLRMQYAITDTLIKETKK